MGEDHGDYGPRGYLPERAAKRARKIVLREQLGVGWITASVIAGVLLLATGVAFVLSQTGPPGPPFVEAVALDEVSPSSTARVEAAGTAVVIVRAGGGLRSYLAPAGAVRYCPDSGHLEGDDDSVWTREGRLIGGPGESLEPVPAQAHAGTIYVDPSAPGPPPAPDDQGARPQCAPPTQD